MPSIQINPNYPASINAALNTEWLLTNGLGGYAMGTALGVNTRRYHGLLVAATKPPVGRIVALHSMIEQLVIPKDDGTEEVIDLSTEQFVGGDGQPLLHPDGWRFLKSFEQQQAHTVDWTWRCNEIEIKKSVSISDAPNSIDVNYWCSFDPGRARLRVRPFIAMRDFHQLNSSGANPWSAKHGRDTGWVEIVSGNIQGDLDAWNGQWQIDVQRWDRFAYNLDRLRGQDWIEHVWSPGFIEFTLADLIRGAGFAASAYIKGHPGGVTSFDHSAVVEQSVSTLSTSLRTAASQFVVDRRIEAYTHKSVIAGYPWFGDWGRDTMIALPGLMLCTGRFDEACSTLLTFARSMKNGLIPNLFDDYGGADHYNTVDASLWFVQAVHALWKAASQPHAELLSACREIIAAYRRGTDFNIRMDPRDGLIAAGDSTTQLTWMDAKRDNIAFTPRNGKPVEINALWFNALRCLAEMTNDTREHDEFVSLSERVAKSFREQFWWNEQKCLHDVLSPREDAGVNAAFAGDRHLRPNQIFAVSLPFSPLTRDQQRAVVKIGGDRLLTPYGLRTLDRDDPQYRGRYEGNLFDRDSAYHQGTVWPWLIGPYCEALLRVNDFSADAKRQVSQIIQPLIDEMSNTSGGRCLNQIAEVYDGDPPHRPSGCPAQAWSVAEVLRIATLVEND